jgi:hypothetical protein
MNVWVSKGVNTSKDLSPIGRVEVTHASHARSVLTSYIISLKRSTHLYIRGSTGTGKSKMLKNLIPHDIAK